MSLVSYIINDLLKRAQGESVCVPRAFAFFLSDLVFKTRALQAGTRTHSTPAKCLSAGSPPAQGAGGLTGTGAEVGGRRNYGRAELPCHRRFQPESNSDDICIKLTVRRQTRESRGRQTGQRNPKRKEGFMEKF